MIFSHTSDNNEDDSEQREPEQTSPEHAAGSGRLPDDRQPTQEAWWEATSSDQESEAPSPTEESAAAEHAAPQAEAAAPGEESDDGTRQLPSVTAPVVAMLRSQRGLAAAAQRDIGRVREVNQDSVFALLTTVPRDTGDITIGLFIVADGMGGHQGGEIASRLAVSTIVRQVLAELVVPALADDMAAALHPLVVSAVQEANRAVWDHAQSIGSDMGTTCTAALLLGRSLYVGHVGDSRAYIRTPMGMRCITTDHSAVGRLIQLGQLDQEEAREHPLRSQLYRTVGQHPEIPVDFLHESLNDATHLVLCSDGLWSMLDESIILDVLDNTLWPQDACHELIARANLAGGEDNIGVVVVTLPG